MDDYANEPELDRLARPKGVQSWRRSNLNASRKPEFHAELPLKVRSVGKQWEQMERARLKVTRAFTLHPENIGVMYAEVWKSPSAAAAIKVFNAMTATAFRPLATDTYRWLLARRGRVIYGTLIPKHSDTWTPEQKKFYTNHQAMKNTGKRGEQFSIPDDEVEEVKFSNQDPHEVIRGLTRQQKAKWDAMQAREEADDE